MAHAGHHLNTASIKVAHLMQSFAMGGGESVALKLATYQVQHGYEVHAISFSSSKDEPLFAAFRGAGCTVQQFPKSSGYDATLSYRLLHYFREQGIQIVHTHDPQSLVYGAPSGKFAHCAVIHTKHGEAIDTMRRRWLCRAASAFTDAYVAVSMETARTALMHHEVAPHKLITIYNGVDCQRFHPNPDNRTALRRELVLNPSVKLIGTIGRLEPVKHQAQLFRAAAPLLTDEVQLIIVGDGSLREELVALAHSLGIASYVHFLGLRNDTDRILASLDIFALSSISEGLPLVVLEAMASGLPIVSTDVGGIANVVIPYRTGMLVSPTDRHELTQALKRMLDDPDEARRLGEAARNTVVENYSIDPMHHSYLMVYRRFLAQPRSRI